MEPDSDQKLAGQLKRGGVGSFLTRQISWNRR